MVNMILKQYIYVTNMFNLCTDTVRIISLEYVFLGILGTSRVYSRECSDFIVQKIQRTHPSIGGYSDYKIRDTYFFSIL